MSFLCRKVGQFAEWKRVFILTICLCLGMTCFTACGKQDIGYNNENTNEDNNSSTELQGTVPEHVSQQEDGVNGASVKVDADVINGEAYGKMPVATLEIKDWSEKEIQQFAESVFDEGSIEVVLPYNRCSQEFLIQEQAEIENRIKELGFTYESVFNDDEYMYLGDQRLAIMEALENYDESKVIENDGSYKWITTILDGGAEELFTCYMKGTVDGKAYAMRFQKGGEFGISMKLQQIKGSYYAERGAILEGIDGERLSSDMLEMFPNICLLTEQEAVDQVQDLVNQLGINDVAVSAVYPARQYIWEYDEETGDGQSTQATKGYLVYLGTAINDFTTPCIEEYLQASCYEYDETNVGYEISTDYDETNADYEMSTGYEGIMALVTDDGIEQFQYINPMTVSEITAEQTAFTSFENINQCAMEYMKSTGGNYDIDTIRLCMGRVKYEDSYALVPVWCYEYNLGISDMTVYRSAIMVNAIDGSIIDVNSGKPVQQ